jgi:hypothetical protein
VSFYYGLSGLVVLLLLAIAYVLRGDQFREQVPLRWRIGIASTIFIVTVVIVLLVRLR